MLSVKRLHKTVYLGYTLSMQINDICRKYNLSRKTVHFYIKSGLVHPHKSENNYYCFNEQNMEEMDLVLRLRQAGMSIQHIRNVLSYPTCANFFLYKQHVSLKKDMCRILNEKKNLEVLIENIPPNGTYEDIMHIPSSAMKIKEISFDEIDAQLTARMTAIFLFTPFMHQKVDDYRQFLWQKIVKITETQLHSSLYDISSHLSQLSTEQVYALSTSLVKLFVQVENGNEDEMIVYLKQCVNEFCQNLEMQEIWKEKYNSFIVPARHVYDECHKTLIKEYTQSYSICMEHMKHMIDRVIASLENEEKDKLMQVTENKFDLSNGYYNDLFILFCMENSVFLSPAIKKELSQ